jgi:hypothetical protein
MTYASGNLIQATDYNGFVSTTANANINATWNTTYGQTALATVSAGGTVSATQWATLNSTISSMATHQGTAITSRTSPVTGNTITALSNVNTDITNCYTNRLNANSVGAQFTAWSGTASFTTNVGNTGGNTRGAWTATFTDTITFANSTAANSFFGAGGYAQIQFGKSSTGTVADTEWNTFIGAAGAGGVVASKVILTSDANTKTIVGVSYQGTYKTGGTGTPSTLATGTGFNQLTTTPTTIYKQFDTGTAYSGNYVQINASKNATGNVITLTTTWFDAGDTNAGSVTTITGGTATSGISFGSGAATVVTMYPPETTNISIVWGSFTVASSVANT